METIKIAPAPPMDRKPRLAEANPSAEVHPSEIESKTPAPPKKRGKLIIRLSIVLAVLAVAGYFGYPMVLDMLNTESTDDAFVSAHVHTITARIAGTVTNVLVDDHQLVKAGQLLVKLDPRDYIAQVQIAQSKYRKSGKDISRMQQGHNTVQDDDFDDGLEDTLPDANDPNRAPVYAPDEKKLVDDYTESRSQAQGELQRSLLHLEFTSVVAPTAGRIGKRTVETGQEVQAGQALMALVEPNPWIDANFKETQLGRIRVGQKVDISIDAIPDHKFTGTVDSISAASGATYSLLPPDNATGNFTKIVQRVPVKIVFDPVSVQGYEDRIAAGMSTEIKIRVK